MVPDRRGQGLDPAQVAGSSAVPENHFSDLGADASYQWTGGDYQATANALYVHERQRLDASFAAGGAERLRGSLDALLYAPSGRPDTRGQMLELDWNPFGQADSWLTPWANLRLGAQYTRYSRFAGRIHNIDEAGRRSSDNNTLFVYAWIAI